MILDDLARIGPLILDRDGRLRMHVDPGPDADPVTVRLGPIESEPDVPPELVAARDELLALWLRAWTEADARAEVLAGYRSAVGL